MADPSVDPHAALLALLTERLATLVEAMPAAQAGDMQSVHQARVATRRLREALPLLRASVKSRALERVRRQVRKMTRALGPVREVDVMLTHLDELAAARVVSTRSLARVRQAVARERLTRRRDMLAVVSGGKVDRMRTRVSEVSESADRAQSAAALAVSEVRIARRARRLAASIERAGGLYLPDRLHAVRIAAKKLRYALEVARELARTPGTARVTQLKRLQDLLGRMHDYEILIDRTRQVQAQLAASDRKLTAELDVLIRKLEADCRADHAIYMHRRLSILKLCAALTPEPAAAAAAVA